MASTSPSTPSEGEIVETDLEKAKPSIDDVRGTNVDRQSRKHASVSRSPTPARSTRQYRSQTRSRSPYREPRGAKRPRENSHNDRGKDDPRHFKVRYEERPFEDRRRLRERYEDLDRHRDANNSLRYDERGTVERSSDKRQRSRSRSPRSARPLTFHDKDSRDRRGARPDGRGWPDRRRQGYKEGNSKLSKEQSVSDRGRSSIAAAYEKRQAEIAEIQKQQSPEPVLNDAATTAEYVPLISSHYLLTGAYRHENHAEEQSLPADPPQPLDEAALIEQRRKRREAIKARHKGQDTPLLVQAVAPEKTLSTSEARITDSLDRNQAEGRFILVRSTSPY